MTISTIPKRHDDFDRSKISIIKSFHPVGYWQDGFLGMKKRHLNGNHLITYTNILAAQDDQLNRRMMARLPVANCPVAEISTRPHGQSSYLFNVKNATSAVSLISKKLSPGLVNLYTPFPNLIIIMHKGGLYMEASTSIPSSHDIKSTWLSIKNKRNYTAVKWDHRIDESIERTANLRYAMAYEFERNGNAHLFIRGFDEDDADEMSMIHVKCCSDGKTSINETTINIKDNENDKRAVNWMMKMMKEEGNE